MALAPAGQPTTAGGSAASCGLAIESQIWTFDGTTYEFTPRWINSNGPAPELYMLLSQDSAQNLYLTGDMSSFEGSFGTNFHIVVSNAHLISFVWQLIWRRIFFMSAPSRPPTFSATITL
jgi:hypothetical protein